MTTVTSDNNSRNNNALLSAFATVDWSAPWCQHLSCQRFISEKVDCWATNDHQVSGEDNETSVADRLNHWRDNLSEAVVKAPFTTGRDLPLRFVPQDDLPEGVAYETFIAQTGAVPTRNNLHDLFNGSIWLTFPKAKAVLNRYQADEIDREGVSGRRGRVRDTITVFDENGAVLVTADPEIGQALADFDWQNCLVRPRASWDSVSAPNPSASAAVYIFGHALLEQLIQPRKPLCSHTLIIKVNPDFFQLPTPQRMAYLDEQLSHRLQALLADESVTPRYFSPLPILGVPHFWPANQDPEFYHDRQVFRSGRRRG